MGYCKYLLILAAVAIIPSFGVKSSPKPKEECKAKPAGISSFRSSVGTRFYYGWSTIQGSAKQAFLSNPSCKGRAQDCSCVGFDVTGYNKTNAELQEGFTFALNKKFNSGDLYHFTRKWTKSGDYFLKCHYDTNYQFDSKSVYKKKYYKSPSSYHDVWAQKPAAVRKVDKNSKPLKVLSWTSTEVVMYNCQSPDPDIRVYTSYIPSKKSEIPYSVFDILTQLGININDLRWIKIDHKNCVYPNKSRYHKLLTELKPKPKGY